MLKLFAFLLVLTLLLLWLYKEHILFGPFNTRSYRVNSQESYKVHRAHHDPEAAARLLSEINKRNETLISHLKGKYLQEFSPRFEPTKNNRIDVIPGSGLYEPGDVIENLSNQMSQEYLQERISQLSRNYNPERIYEISPRNTGNATSYTEDKKVLVLCLRRKEPNASGDHLLHDINTMMFVTLHELAHMMNNAWDHHLDFWVLFKFLLLNAVEAGIYTPVNYAQKPVVYCGLKLHYNPYFDPRI